MLDRTTASPVSLLLDWSEGSACRRCARPAANGQTCAGAARSRVARKRAEQCLLLWRLPQSCLPCQLTTRPCLLSALAHARARHSEPGSQVDGQSERRGEADGEKQASQAPKTHRTARAATGADARACGNLLRALERRHANTGPCRAAPGPPATPSGECPPKVKVRIPTAKTFLSPPPRPPEKAPVARKASR